MKFGVIGLGVVGSCYKRWLEREGFEQEVVGYDIKGEGSIEEVSTADVIFIAVNTPFDANTNAYHTGYVDDAVGAIEGDGKVIVIASTVPVGTCVRLAVEHQTQHILHNPEFLRAKTAWTDFCKPVRQILGVTSPASIYKAKALLPYLPDGDYAYTVQSDVSELIKLSSNMILATKIAVAQKVLELAGGNEDVADILALDRRIGAYGFDQSQQVGYSGRCLPKDVRGFLHECDEAGIDSGWLVEMDRANARTLASQGLAVDFGWPLALKEAVHE